MNSFETKLTNSMQELLSYVQKKVQDEALAADVLQSSLLKALRASESLRDEDKLFPWFYRILDNTIHDIYRSRQRERKYLSAFASEAEIAISTEENTLICTCFIQLLPTIKPEYAKVIRMLDLDEENHTEVASKLGITRGNLKVRHHRARRQLRQRLEEICRVCSKHGCLDCSCASRGEA